MRVGDYRVPAFAGTTPRIIADASLEAALDLRQRSARGGVAASRPKPDPAQEPIMIKDIIVHLERDASRDSVRDYAISMAEAFDAHLAAVSFAGASIPGYLMPGITPDVLSDIFAESENAGRAAIERFDAAAQRSRVSAERRLVTSSEPEPSRSFAAMARRFDLAIVMQSDFDRGFGNDILIEAALFESGRPIIVVPYIQKDGVSLERIVCCWDGSRAAARAINDALPLLKKARAVELFIVADQKAGSDRKILGIDIGRHLARHGVEVEIETLPGAGIEVANAILSHAADCSANLIVMGGYGHSRLREFMLGGVTHAMLSTMTVPVLMSH
jgi:nucleotide-binding universal stress UspA family protein